MPVLWETFRKHGILVGVEVDSDPIAGRLIVILPQGKHLYPIARLLGEQFDFGTKELQIQGLSVLVGPGDAMGSAGVATWVDGDDLVICFAKETPEQMVKRGIERREHNLTHSKLFQRLTAFKDYETLSQGFVDIPRIIDAASKSPDGAMVRKVVDGLGLGNVHEFTWHTGFGGRHQRSTFQIYISGERKGLLRVLAGDANFRPEQLPPLPPDTTSLHVVHLNLTGFYEGIREAIAGVSNALGEDAAAQVRTFDDELHEATKNLGIDLQKDLLDTLGTTMVVYSAPSEGLLGIGTGVAIQVKDVDMLRRTLDEIGKAIASQGDGSVRIVQREYHGVALYVLLTGSDSNVPFTPTYTIHRGWLVAALNPQTVEGYIMRTEGKYDVWKPSPLFAEVLSDVKRRSPQAKIVGMGESDPRPMLKFVLSFAPLIGSYLGNSSPEKFDNTKIPNTQAILAPLYPNVSIMVDDGESLRWDSYKSAPFPLDGNLMARISGRQSWARRIFFPFF